MSSTSSYTVESLALLARNRGQIPIAHNSTGVPVDRNWLRCSNPDISSFSTASGLSLKLGRESGLVAIEIRDYAKNKYYSYYETLSSGTERSEVELDRFERSETDETDETMTVKVGLDLWLLHLYQPDYRKLAISSTYSARVGLWLHVEGRAPYYGLQESGASIGPSDLTSPGVVSSLPTPLLGKLVTIYSRNGPVTVPVPDGPSSPSAGHQESPLDVPDPIPVSDYHNKYHNYRGTEEMEVTTAVFSAYVRYNLMFVPHSHVTEREKWERLASLALATGCAMVKVLYDFTFRDGISSCISRKDYDSYCETYYTTYPQLVQPQQARFETFISYVEVISSENYERQAILGMVHEEQQLDLEEGLAANDFFRSVGNSTFYYPSLDAAVFAIVEGMQRFTRYIAETETAIIRYVPGGPVRIVHRPEVHHRNKVVSYVRYYRAATDDKPRTAICSTVNVFDVYRKYHYASADGAMFVPYVPGQEDPRAVMTFHLPVGCSKRYYINTFSGYAAKLIAHEKMDMERLYIIRAHYYEVLASGEEPLYEWILGRIAMMVRYPRFRCETIPIFVGKQGCGKTSAFSFLVHCVFGDEISTTTYSTSLLTRRFNSTLENLVFALIDGVSRGGEDPRRLSTLGSLTTGDRAHVERKYMEVRNVANFTNFAIISDDGMAIPVERDNRHYTLIECSDKYTSTSDVRTTDDNATEITERRRAISNAYFKRFREACDSPGMGDTFYTFLMEMVPDEWVEKAKHIYPTKLRDRVVAHFEPKPQLYYHELVSGEHELPWSQIVRRDTTGTDGSVVAKLYIKANDLYNDFLEWCRSQNYQRVSKNTFGGEFCDKLETTRIRVGSSTHCFRRLSPDFTYYKVGLVHSNRVVVEDVLLEPQAQAVRADVAALSW